ncbi:MAG TPA: family 10 glycosylhydrolase [Candidatus Sulfotelmatobacter sp.]|nr:family 10 glycosylhydrolase [Candidatus Sulfotelmatobacter sp.]
MKRVSSWLTGIAIVWLAGCAESPPPPVTQEVNPPTPPPKIAPAPPLAQPPSPNVSSVVPPAPQREFRAAWIATVGNSCWPSKPGLPVAQQKAELLAMLDRAAAMKMNAVIFQVRPACDALYASSLEPWSEYLTGVQGRAPQPFYDPLAYAIQEAHKRGLELHAWFNPFRAHHFQSVSPICARHISRTHPEMVRSYGKYLWLDPGEPAVRDYSLGVIMDVVKRYDVDGIHLDDYFYPYHETNSFGDISFPDSPSWKKYGVASGLSRDDWRRQNVDVFVEQLYHSIKGAKPWVKFGISPFGIWRPKNPPGISGFDSYQEIYCDSRKWLRAGWCDYIAPQLYWGIQPPKTSFTTLLNWWEGENIQHRHVWPGMDSLKVGEKWQPEEIENQITFSRQYPGAGHIHWSINALMRNPALDSALVQNIYQQPALIPASPWLGSTPPPQPDILVTGWKNSVHVGWKNSPGEPASWWVLQFRENGNWTTQILPPGRSDAYLDSAHPDALAVRAVSRTGILGEAALWKSQK